MTELERDMEEISDMELRADAVITLWEGEDEDFNCHGKR